jgi:hypothetical protein
MFKIEFATDNAAFGVVSENPLALRVTACLEVERILNTAAFEMGRFEISPGSKKPIKDVNGNTVGFLEWEEEEA